jgi:hypothetical protein
MGMQPQNTMMPGVGGQQQTPQGMQQPVQMQGTAMQQTPQMPTMAQGKAGAIRGGVQPGMMHNDLMMHNTMMLQNPAAQGFHGYQGTAQNPNMGGFSLRANEMSSPGIGAQHRDMSAPMITPPNGVNLT